MIKRILQLFISALIVVITSCNSSNQKKYETLQRVGSPKDTVNYTELYSDVFDQLIIHHTYDKYLGCDGEKLQRNFIIEENIDSVAYTIRKRKIIEKILKSAAPKSVVYVDTLYEGNGFIDMAKSYFSTPDSAGRKFLNKFSVEDTAKILATLKRVKEFSLDSLNSELVEVRPNADRKAGYFIRCDVIGSLSISQVYLNKDNDMGLLFWSFACGPKCGRGELIKIKYGKEGWKIIDTDLSYIN